MPHHIFDWPIYDLLAHVCNQASDILGYDLLAKCVDGPKEELDSTVIAQTAIFVSSMAALEKLKRDDPEAIEKCTVAMGLSLGEYTARALLVLSRLKTG